MVSTETNPIPVNFAKEKDFFIQCLHTRDLTKSLQSFDAAIQAALTEYPGAANAIHMFWGVQENRGYLRALHYRSLVLAQTRPLPRSGCRSPQNRSPESPGQPRCHFTWLFITGDMVNLERLLIQYKASHMTAHAWAHALYAFVCYQNRTLSAAARDATLAAAVKVNKNVKRWLVEEKMVDISDLPEHGPANGDPQALCYVMDGLTAWRAVPGALEWLRSM
ncbi:hypothetical protein HK097_009432 [Rhizophlyctis rosea]|uniref:Uncharacterized protein n=1 Tax=Rhizophlyctis rosea TaxID=64517 RepID=A0AAD5SC11_9FUNG|nr:hypothetical protein HK097_009432 [Rhizophlyctis rosea]